MKLPNLESKFMDFYNTSMSFMKEHYLYAIMGAVGVVILTFLLLSWIFIKSLGG